VLIKTRHIDEYSHTLIANLTLGGAVGRHLRRRPGREPFELEWVSMHDSKVRHTHRGGRAADLAGRSSTSALEDALARRHPGADQGMDQLPVHGGGGADRRQRGGLGGY
jgi:hypothetical protein